MRKLIHWFVCAPAFDKFIMIVICFASFCIAAEDPVDEANPRNYYLSKADYVFTITFACEVCLKVIMVLLFDCSPRLCAKVKGINTYNIF